MGEVDAGARVATSGEREKAYFSSPLENWV
jgi:hypothetical protein